MKRVWLLPLWKCIAIHWLRGSTDGAKKTIINTKNFKLKAERELVTIAIATIDLESTFSIHVKNGDSWEYTKYSLKHSGRVERIREGKYPYKWDKK